MTEFFKMHGIGNDFVLVDAMGACRKDWNAFAVRVCMRNTGIGADGLLVVGPSDKADCRMQIFNADGSEALMCGNGIRCVAKYIADKGIVTGPEASVETASGIRSVKLHRNGNGTVHAVTVDMGRPRFLWPEITRKLITSQGPVNVTGVSTGNPHGVVIGASPELFDILGPELEHHSVWPDRANIEFVELVPECRHAISVRTWERGVGETLACGTGACAAAAAMAASGYVQWPVTVQLRGGRLDIDMKEGGNLLMTGPAVTVFKGSLDD